MVEDSGIFEDYFGTSDEAVSKKPEPRSGSKGFWSTLAVLILES